MAKKKGMWKILAFFVVILVLLAVAAAVLYQHGVIPHRVYTEKDFHIERVVSTYDFNKNGVDDYFDFLLGAREDAEKYPYFETTTGQEEDVPPDESDVCPGMVWRAFLKAGYNLKGMVNADIKVNKSKYPAIKGDYDPETDFHKVENLKVFFDRYALSLTTDPNEIAEWQPGDIVVFGTDHIGIVSDKRNRQGIPYLIHTCSYPNVEGDTLVQMNESDRISGHYRFRGDVVYRGIFNKVLRKYY